MICMKLKTCPSVSFQIHVSIKCITRSKKLPRQLQYVGKFRISPGIVQHVRLLIFELHVEVNWSTPFSQIFMGCLMLYYVIGNYFPGDHPIKRQLLMSVHSVLSVN